PGIPESFKVLIKELESLALDVKVLDENQNEIDLKQEFDDDDIPVADNSETLEEDEVMTTMDGFVLDEDSEEGNMFDESSIVEDANEMLDFDDYGSDEF
ncbi:MAG: hypothetical protein SO152_06750, partial [Ruminococcus sp.]|nr:hypothetical protein [Ruminococcus sp.]